MDNKNLEYWRHNAEEDYIKTPLSVLKYITELEKQIKWDQHLTDCASN